jgi:hypothetical protein
MNEADKNNFIQGEVASGNETEDRFEVSEEAYSLAEDELLRRLSSPNETLFETEANKIFVKVRFLSYSS